MGSALKPRIKCDKWQFCLLIRAWQGPPSIPKWISISPVLLAVETVQYTQVLKAKQTNSLHDGFPAHPSQVQHLTRSCCSFIVQQSNPVGLQGVDGLLVKIYILLICLPYVYDSIYRRYYALILLNTQFWRNGDEYAIPERVVVKQFNFGYGIV